MSSTSGMAVAQLGPRVLQKKGGKGDPSWRSALKMPLQLFGLAGVSKKGICLVEAAMVSSGLGLRWWWNVWLLPSPPLFWVLLFAAVLMCPAPAV